MGCLLSKPASSRLLSTDASDADRLTALHLSACRMAATGRLSDLMALYAEHDSLRLDFPLSRAEIESEPVFHRFAPGVTMYDLALQQGHMEVAQWLRTTSFGPGFEAKQHTAQSVPSEREGGMREPLLSRDRGVAYELKEGAVAVAPKESLLWQAAARGSLADCKRLLEDGTAIDAVQQDRQRRTPLMAASFHGRAAVVEYLLQCGASETATDATGTTAERLAGASRSCHASHRRAVQAVFAQWARSGKVVVPVRTSEEHQQAVLAQQQRLMTLGMEASRVVAFRLAKMVFHGTAAVAPQLSPAPAEDAEAAAKVVSPAPVPSVDRSALQSLLYETISCHPVVFHLSGLDLTAVDLASSGVAASTTPAPVDQARAAALQLALCDALLHTLKLYLDEPPAEIAAEVNRCAFAFLNHRAELAQRDESLRKQIEATEHKVAALQAAMIAQRSASSQAPVSAGPKQADWAKRFQTAATIYAGIMKLVVRH